MPPKHHVSIPSAAMQRISEDEAITVELYGAYTSGAPSSRHTSSHSGPCPPCGWLIDVNDPLVMAYDPYFNTAHLQRLDAAPQQLREGDRHYAQDEIAVCKVDTLARTTQPPAGEVVLSNTKGRHVVATRAIKAGELIAMDRSIVSSVQEPLAYLYPPPDVDRHGGSVPLGSDKGSLTDPSTARDVASAVRFVMQSVTTMHPHTVHAVVLTQRLQSICSLLVEYGDMMLLPRSFRGVVQPRDGRALCACGKTELTSLFPRAFVARSALCERMTSDMLACWWRDGLELGRATAAGEATSCVNYHNIVDSSGATHSAEADRGVHDQDRLRQARLVLQCLPSSLLTVKPHDDLTPCCQQQFSVYGFLARLGLHRPSRLAAWFAIWDGNAMQVQVPDLLKRTALFPFARFLEHECRPNALVLPLDCPATHTYGVAGRHHYDTKAEDYVDPYSGEAAERQGRPYSQQQLTALWWPCKTTQRIWCPSWIAITAMRDIAAGESISISYIPAACTPQSMRVKELQEAYHFTCHCRWCTQEPDLARGFRCPKCPANEGVICPVGDGQKLDLWECLQCGYRPSIEDEIPKMLDAEAALMRVKADKSSGLVSLLNDAWVHYSHALVFRKLDQWSEAAWRAQDGPSCIAFLEALQRATRRFVDPRDPTLAQHHEFMGQVQHALGNAHTSRFEYFLAYQIRIKCGGRFMHWTRLTQFMAAEKSLVDFLDSR